MSAKKSQAVFERHEQKYRITLNQYERLRDALLITMSEDAYGLHTICSLYYDTPDYSVIRHSLDKPRFKEKLRLRSYGIPRAHDAVFLELKKKLNGVTYKRRMQLTLREARRYLEQGITPMAADQIFFEIDQYVSMRPVEPKALICYDRVALFGRENNALRITFDANIRWRDYQLDLSKGDHGSLLLPPDERLMEIKVPGAMPYWLCGLLSDLNVYPSSYSKYGVAFRDCMLPGAEVRYVG